MKILVTGAAGFIGSHLSEKLLGTGHQVLGIDNLNDYYSVQLKKDRISKIQKAFSNFTFSRLDIVNGADLKTTCEDFGVERIIHLAAQAGVRYSITNPSPYVQSNVVGFLNVLETARTLKVDHLVYASTSSVYGSNTKMPFSVHDPANHPITLYAATKKANEVMAHSYSHLYQIPTTGLRFFTVYGPWGRPDMALFVFTKNILEGRPIEIFNDGKHRRDFTYIDDVVEGIYRISHMPAAPDPKWSGAYPDPSTSNAPYRLYNIGGNQPVELLDFVRELEATLGKKAQIVFKGLQQGDVVETCADATDLEQAVNFIPRVSYREGIANFVRWYREYYGRNGIGIRP